VAVNFHILQSSGILTGAMYDQLHSVLLEISKQCGDKIKLSNVDVVVMNVPWNIIPRIGINGFSYDAHQIILSIDSNHDYLKANFEKTITAVLSHELHHSARSLARGSSHSHTYGGSLVAEGLACCFEEEICDATPFYAIECNGAALAKFSIKAKEHIFTKRENLPGNWQQWMFGNFGDDPEFPYQCGYSIGYALVRSWLNKEDMSASSATTIDENEILDAWLNESVSPC